MEKHGKTWPMMAPGIPTLQCQFRNKWNSNQTCFSPRFMVAALLAFVQFQELVMPKENWSPMSSSSFATDLAFPFTFDNGQRCAQCD